MTDNTIAVLPFVNMSPDPENEYFSDGITEEIINALARLDNLKVISRTSSFFFKGKNLPLKDIAGQLNVSIVLEGSVRVAGHKVRITAQLIQAADDFHFWSETWDRQLENIFEVQDEISLLIAEKLREQLGHFDIADHLVKKQTESVDAYTLLLKGNYHFNKWNPGDVQTAIGLYEQALALDPNHTPSYVGLADAYSFMAVTQFMPRAEAWPKAVEATHKAYALDPNHAGVHYQLANLSFFTDCNFADAMSHTVRALQLKPGYPEAQQYMAFLYILSGQIDKAKHHLQLALAIDPFNQETLFYKAYYLYRTGSYEQSLLQLDDCLDKNQKNIPALVVKAYCLLMLKRYAEVHTLFDAMPGDIVIPDERLGTLCLTHILEGNQLQTKSHLEELEQEAEKPTSFQAHSYLYLAYACMGENDKAFAFLEKALQLKSAVLQLGFSDPLGSRLFSDPRHKAFHKVIYAGADSQIAEPVRKTALDDHVAERHCKALLAFVAAECPYLNPDLTLRLLAEQVQIHPNQLSWLLNEKVGKNFNEFINHYRVEHFKTLANDPANSHISLVGLAYESGFNSKTVFNTFFKKETGMTPSEYLKSTT